jgi:hypothetical protein
VADKAVPIIAKCDECGWIFHTGFGVTGMGSLSHCSSVCPNCRFEQPIPDGTYAKILGRAMRVFFDEPDPVAFGSSLIQQLSTVTDQASLDELVANSPEAKKLDGLLTLPVLSFIVAMLSLLVTAWQTFGPQASSKTSVDQIIEAYNRGISGRATSASRVSLEPAQTQPSIPTRKKRTGSHTPAKDRNRSGRRKRH